MCETPPRLRSCFWEYRMLTGGETEEEQIRVDVLENQAMDFRNAFVMLCYNPDFVCATS